MANKYIESNLVARSYRSKRRGIQPDKLCVKLFLLDPEKNITKINRDMCCKKESERLKSLGYGAPPSDFLNHYHKVEFPFSMTTEEFKDKLVEIYPKLNNVEYLLMKADKSYKLQLLNLHTSFYNPEDIYYSNLGKGKLYIRCVKEHSQTTSEGPLAKRPCNSTTSESQSSDPACPVYRMIRPRLATSQSTTVSTAPSITASVSSTPTNIAPGLNSRQPEAGCTTLTAPSVCTSGVQLSIPTDQSGNVTTTSVPLSSGSQNNSNVGTSLTNSVVSQQPQQLLRLLQQLVHQQPQQLLQQQPQQLLQKQEHQHQQQPQQLPQQQQQHQGPLQPQLLSYQQPLQQQTQHFPLQLRQEQQNHHHQKPLHQQQEQIPDRLIVSLRQPTQSCIASLPSVSPTMAHHASGMTTSFSPLVHNSSVNDLSSFPSPSLSAQYTPGVNTMNTSSSGNVLNFPQTLQQATQQPVPSSLGSSYVLQNESVRNTTSTSTPSSFFSASCQADMSRSLPLNTLADATVEQGPINEELMENEGLEEDASSSDMEETSTNSRSDELDPDDFLERCEQTGHLDISPKVFKHSSVLERLQSSITAIHSVKINKYCKLDEVLEGFPLPLSLKVLTIKKNCLDDSGMKSLVTRAILHLKNVEELDLSGTLLMGNRRFMFISGLADLTALKRLCLRNNKFCQREAASLAAALPSLINLEILNLSKNYISDEDMQKITCALAKLKHLKELELSGNNLCETKSLLNGIASVRSIEKLDLSCNHGGTSSLDVQNAEKYEFLSSLKVLSLSSNSMIPNDFRFLGTILFLSTSLEELTLDFNHVGASIWALYPLTRAAFSLKKLSLTNTEIKGKGLSSFLTNLGKLEVLNLGSNNLSSNDFQYLQPCLSKLNNLRVLNLSDNPGGSSLSSVLKHILPSLKSLEDLNVSNTHLDGTGLGTICHVIGSLKGLKRLDVSNNMIGSEGADALAKVLPSLQNLEELDVSKTRVCGDGMNAMCAAIESLVNLKSLSLSSNKLGSVAGTALAISVSSLHLLEELNLRATGLDDNCMETLFHKCGWPRTLKKLILSENTLERSGASALARKLLSMTSLEEFNLEKCYINEECFEVISRSFSKLNHLEKLTLSMLSSHSVDSLTSVLSSLQSLEELVLDGMDLYDDDAKELCAAIGSLKYLKKLHFRFSDTCSVGALASRLPSLQLLEELQLGKMALSDGGDDEKLFLAIGSLKYLKKLDLWGIKIGSTGAAVLASVLRSLQLLEELVLDDMCYDEDDLDDDDAKELCAAIGSLKYLKKLHFRFSDTCSVGALASRLPSLQLLEELQLGKIALSDGGDDEKQFLAIGSLKYLKKLDLWGIKIGYTGAAVLASVLRSLQLLEELVLDDMCYDEDDLDDDDAKELCAAIGSLKYLKKLHFRFSDTCSVGALASRLPSLQLLEELQLGKIALSDGGDDEKLFLAIGSLKYLKKLDLWGIEIGSTGAAALPSVLRSLQLLEELQLGKMYLSDGDDEKLFLAMGSLKYLKKLRLWGIEIGSTGAAALPSVLRSLQLLEELQLGKMALSDGGDDEKLFLAMGSLKYLKKLRLWGIEIGSTGAAALASVLPSLQLLEELWLGEMYLSDGDDEKLFLAMGSLKYLKKLGLWGIKLSSTGVAALASVLPLLQLLEDLQLGKMALSDGGDDEKLFLAMGSLKYLKKLDLRVIMLGSTGVTALASVLPSLHALKQCKLSRGLSSSDQNKLESAAGPRVRFSFE